MSSRSSSPKSMPSIVAFLKQELGEIAPKAHFEATSITVKGEPEPVENALVSLRDGGLGVAFYPKDGGLIIAIAQDAAQKQFAYPNVHQKEFDAEVLIETIASTAITHQVDAEFQLLRRAEKEVGAGWNMLKMAEYMVSKKFPFLPVTVHETKDGVTSMEIDGAVITCRMGSKDPDWESGEQQFRDGLQAVAMVTGNVVGARVAAAFKAESRNEKPEGIDFEKLWSLVADQASIDIDSDHGIEHWKRVERNGLLLATKTGADPTVMRLFAVFHDSRRENEYEDPDHGARGSKLALEWRGVHFDCTDEQMEKLVEACDGHTDGFHHDDPTVGSCWDADRLDLGRVGMRPDARYMSTEFAREIANQGSVERYLSQSQDLPAEHSWEHDEIGGNHEGLSH